MRRISVLKFGGDTKTNRKQEN